MSTPKRYLHARVYCGIFTIATIIRVGANPADKWILSFAEKLMELDDII
jgi:hypothetical protein